MNKKTKFLPTNNFEDDEYQPMLDQHKNAAFLLRMKDSDLEKNSPYGMYKDHQPKGSLGYYDMINIENLNKNMVKSLKAKSWAMNMLSIFTFLILLFGGTLFGFSFKLVGEKQVGYYDNEIGYYEPGSYFQFPWMKHQFHIINIGIEHLQLNDITGYSSTDNVKFTIKTLNIIYNVNDVDLYVKAIKDVGGIKQFLKLMEIQITNEIINDLKDRSSVDIEKIVNIPIDVKEYGITIKTSHITRPFLHNTYIPSNLLQKLKKTETLKTTTFEETTKPESETLKPTSKNTEPEVTTLKPKNPNDSDEKLEETTTTTTTKTTTTLKPEDEDEDEKSKETTTATTLKNPDAEESTTLKEPNNFEESTTLKEPNNYDEDPEEATTLKEPNNYDEDPEEA
ncbi:MAG: hypothetical protein ACRCZ0_04145, partial [Cetobacterium sp.]